VVWPENSSDIDPLRNPDAAQQIAAAATADRRADPGRRGAAGRRARRDQERRHPVAAGHRPDLDQVYIKRHPVPFAEYMPLRPIARVVQREGSTW
jgi:apolipoprotein N-acyltransferase